MLAEVDEALKNYRKEFPSLKDRKPEWGGFVWFQGWNDMFNQDALAQYEQNLVHLIKDLRAHLKQPNLPVVVGELGNMGEDAGKNMKAIRPENMLKKGCSNETKALAGELDLNTPMGKMMAAKAAKTSE